MPHRRKPRTLSLVKPKAPLGFSPELQRVVSSAARDVARELGRQAAREVFAKMVRSSTTSS